jgi:hypothetical protein
MDGKAGRSCRKGQVMEHHGQNGEWIRARGFDDARELMARWLEGHVRTRPDYFDSELGPDTETHEFGMAPRLADLNRSGYLTTGSQPGHDFLPDVRGHLWRQRAEVDGWLRADLAAHVVERLARADLAFVVGERHDADPSLIRLDGRIPVTERRAKRRWRSAWADPITTASIAVEQPAERLDPHNSFDLLTAEAREDIARSSVFLLVLDPRWGDNRTLWETLARALGHELAEDHQEAAANNGPTPEDEHDRR